MWTQLWVTTNWINWAPNRFTIEVPDLCCSRHYSIMPSWAWAQSLSSPLVVNCPFTSSNASRQASKTDFLLCLLIMQFTFMFFHQGVMATGSLAYLWHIFGIFGKWFCHFGTWSQSGTSLLLCLSCHYEEQILVALPSWQELLQYESRMKNIPALMPWSILYLYTST